MNDTVTSVFTVPEPINVQELTNELDGKLNIFNRITFAFSDPVKTHALVRWSENIFNKLSELMIFVSINYFQNQSPFMKKFNLYAVIPKTQAAFQVNSILCILVF